MREKGWIFDVLLSYQGGRMGAGTTVEKGGGKERIEKGGLGLRGSLVKKKGRIRNEA